MIEIVRAGFGLRFPTALAVLCLAASATQCASVPKRHYFTLSYPLDQDRARTAVEALHPIHLRLKPLDVALPYNRPQIVYRQSPFEYKYYAYRLWAAKPQHMIRELMEDHFQAAGLVSEVSRDYGEKAPDYELGGEVQAVEEYDSGDVWYGHLSMRLELVRFEDHKPIWHYQFDRKSRVYEKQPVHVVQALSKILEEEMVRITAELDRVLSKERGTRPTLTNTAPLPEADGSFGGPSDEPAGEPLEGGDGQMDDLIVPDEEIDG